MFLKPFLTLLYMFRASKLEVSQLFHVQEVPDRPSKIPQHRGPADKEFISILLQLIQSIQYDTIGESSMAQHLLKRSKRNKRARSTANLIVKTFN